MGTLPFHCITLYAIKFRWMNNQHCSFIRILKSCKFLIFQISQLYLNTGLPYLTLKVTIQKIKKLSQYIKINKSIIAQCSGVEMSIVTTGQLAIIGWGWVWSDWGGWYPPKTRSEVDNNLRDLDNSSQHTKDESNPIIVLIILSKRMTEW